jgi:hypothetical protein
MGEYSLSHLSDADLLLNLSQLVGRDRATTAKLIAHIAEVDTRRLYAEAGYPSMFAYCVEELHFSEDAAGRRIHAARVARRFPALLRALEDGRLNLTAVCLLAAHLTEENLEELIVAATHKGKSEIEEWLVGQALGPRAPARSFSIKPVVSRTSEHALAHTGSAPTLEFFGESAPALEQGERGRAPSGFDQYALAHTGIPAEIATPLPEQFRMQVTIPRSMRDKLSHALALLSHAIPTGDVVQVLDRALDALIVQLEKRKFGGKASEKTP